MQSATSKVQSELAMLRHVRSVALLSVMVYAASATLLGIGQSGRGEASAQAPSTPDSGKKCGKCGKSVPSYAQPGQKCPHCGAYWQYERNTATGETRHPPRADRGWADYREGLQILGMWFSLFAFPILTRVVPWLQVRGPKGWARRLTKRRLARGGQMLLIGLAIILDTVVLCKVVGGDIDTSMTLRLIVSVMLYGAWVAFIGIAHFISGVRNLE